jgi:hypothetical protein
MSPGVAEIVGQPRRGMPVAAALGEWLVHTDRALIRTIRLNCDNDR